MPEPVKNPNWLLGIVGAVAGGAVGYVAFFFLARLGMYGLVLPGALLGLGCGALAGVKTNGLGLVCGLLAIFAGIFTEWRFAPFVDDRSLVYFIAHVGDLSPTTLASIVVGGLFGFWFGRGRDGGVWRRREQNVGARTQHDMVHMRAAAGAHMRRDMEAGGKWVCQCPDCHEIRSLIGVDKTLEVRPLVRKVLRLEEQLEALSDGPEKRAILEEYLKAYDELAEVMAK
jgi:hypothetical protein